MILNDFSNRKYTNILTYDFSLANI